MVFVIMALLFGAIVSRFLGSDMIQTGSINTKNTCFSNIYAIGVQQPHIFSLFWAPDPSGEPFGPFGLHACKKHVFSRISVLSDYKNHVFSGVFGPSSWNYSYWGDRFLEQVLGHFGDQNRFDFSVLFLIAL